MCVCVGVGVCVWVCVWVGGFMVDWLHTETLMAVLFEVTNIDFQLTVTNSSFLDETWVLPVVLPISIAPVKTLNMLLRYSFW